MLRKMSILPLGIIIIGSVFLYFKTRTSPSTNYIFDNSATANIAELVKKRPANAELPNVVILLADDLGWADVGYRGSDIQTPNIDKLAFDGMRLERFYATPFCSPTRAALMTARDPIKLGVAHSVLMAWSN